MSGTTTRILDPNNPQDAAEIAAFNEPDSQSGSQQAYQPTASQDVVGIFDSNFNQLFQDARPIRASVKQLAKIFNHPLETGVKITDHMVIEPHKIDLYMILTPATYVQTFSEIVAIWKAGTVLNVQTNVGAYGDMVIAELPHEEDTLHFDTITMQIKLQHAIFVTSQTSKLPPGSSKVNKGNKTAAATTPNTAESGTNNAKGSALWNLFGYGTPAAPTATEHE